MATLTPRSRTLLRQTTCTITKIYDQSPNHSDLRPHLLAAQHMVPNPTGYISRRGQRSPCNLARTAGLRHRHLPRNGLSRLYPCRHSGNGQPEGVYIVTSALHLNTKCCFDLGNAEVNNLDNDAGHMDAINIKCNGSPCKPDAGLDMENGIYGHLPVPPETEFVTDMGANDGQHSYAIYQGNAQSGKLTTTGILPLPAKYQPMNQEGAIILGTGGDNSNWASGYFFEGVMTSGMPERQRPWKRGPARHRGRWITLATFSHRNLLKFG